MTDLAMYAIMFTIAVVFFGAGTLFGAAWGRLKP